jgi:F0F1-type ATP synthase alpha subunit
VTELLKQPQYQPLQVWELAVSLYAANKGYLDDSTSSKCCRSRRACTTT